MKPGDKVWVFLHTTQEITEGKVFRMYHLFGTDYVQIYYTSGVLSGGFRVGWDVFPTREALCEHYRKIFDL